MRVITANRLSDGEVVWFAHGDQWVEALQLATVLSSQDEAAALAEAQVWVAKNIVVDVYAIDVVVEGGRVVPQRLREIIRAAGPSMRTDLGKQARRAVSPA